MQCLLVMDNEQITHWEDEYKTCWVGKNAKCHEIGYRGFVYRYRFNQLGNKDAWDFAGPGDHGWYYCPLYLVPKKIQLILFLLEGS